MCFDIMCFCPAASEFHCWLLVFSLNALCLLLKISFALFRASGWKQNADPPSGHIWEPSNVGTVKEQGVHDLRGVFRQNKSAK